MGEAHPTKIRRRIEKVQYDNYLDSAADVTTTHYYYNNNWQVLTETDGACSVKRSYVYGNYIDEVLMMIDHTDSDKEYYYAHDHLFSPVALLESDGDVVERYEYDTYGMPTIWNPDFTATRSTSSYGNPFYFTGREADFLDNAQLILGNFRGRITDFYTGRWLTQDTLGVSPVAKGKKGLNQENRKSTYAQNQLCGCRTATMISYKTDLPFESQSYKKRMIKNTKRLVPEIQYIDGMNLYEYVRINPVIHIDPDGTISKSCCQTQVDNLLRNDLVIMKVVLSIMQAKDEEGESCWGGIKCKKTGEPWCFGVSAYYNPFTKRVSLCADKLSVDGLRKTLLHELLHSKSLCGTLDFGCTNCMIEEKMAYYWSDLCDTNEQCTQAAWASCTSNTMPFACSNSNDKWQNHINDGSWPPKVPK